MSPARAPRLRQVYLLAGIAAALTIAAILAVTLSRAPSRAVFTPEAYFPGLEAKAKDVRRIHIQDKDGSVDLAFAPETGWVATDKDGYPARYDKIQELVQSLEQLQRYEKKTALEKWQARLLLTDPRDKGMATLVQLLPQSGAPLAEILLGSNADVDAAGGEQQIYARAPGDNQVWLARGAGLSHVSSSSEDWLDRTIIDVPKRRIARAEVKPMDGPAYAVVHASAEAENFTVQDLPAGTQLKAETSANGVGTVLTDLGFRDAARADRVTFTPASPSATYETFNGLRIRIETIKLGEDTWARLTASVSEKADDLAKEEAADLGQRLTPWVFELESWKARQLSTSLDSITEPAHGGEAKGKTSEKKPAGGGANAIPETKASPRSSPAKTIEKKDTSGMPN